MSPAVAPAQLLRDAGLRELSVASDRRWKAAAAAAAPCGPLPAHRGTASLIRNGVGVTRFSPDEGSPSVGDGDEHMRHTHGRRETSSEPSSPCRLLLRRGGNLTGLLALLAPLAALPLIAGTALPLSMAPLLAPAMSTVLGRRRRRDLLAAFVGNNEEQTQQQDEVLAGYLQCSGMLAADNHCLERLACQFSADALRGPLHKDVASLVIYTLLRNRFIPERFKQRLRLAARQARPSPAHCLRRFPCAQQRRPAPLPSS
ncbi:uncharacterized protein LOC142570251 [Dermacentor variabilis]|uniref:uncharacterized protein LOC142570251 n=1 Tax=Dermacentor variabilis TaxID=34621 RepID=UPI003F5B23B0